MTAFAVVADVAARLNRTFDAGETTQLTALLDDATAYLQSVIGQSVIADSGTVVLSLPPEATWVDLPQWPVTDVTLVEVGPSGSEVATTDYELIDHALYLRPCWHQTTAITPDSGYRRVVVTYDYGYATVPADLKAWAIVLAAQAFAQVGALGSLGSAGVQQERVDDYSVTYATSGEAAQPFSLPVNVIDLLRSKYGRSAFVTGSR